MKPALGTTGSLMERMQAELDAGEKSRNAIRSASVRSVEERDRKIGQFDRDCERLAKVWKPRLEAFASKFGDAVQASPKLTAARREATFEVVTGLAATTLKFGASLDVEAGTLVLDYDLLILPVFMDYERHARFEATLGDVDAEPAVAAWIEDRLIDFLRAYRAMFENEHYLARSMVEDPIVHVRFPRHAAAFTLERGGKSFHFIGAETKAEFERREAAQAQDPSPVPAAAPPTTAPAAKTAPTPPAPAPAPSARAAGGSKPGDAPEAPCPP